MAQMLNLDNLDNLQQRHAAIKFAWERMKLGEPERILDALMRIAKVPLSECSLVVHADMRVVWQTSQAQTPHGRVSIVYRNDVPRDTIALVPTAVVPQDVNYASGYFKRLSGVSRG